MPPRQWRKWHARDAVRPGFLEHLLSSIETEVEDPARVLRERVLDSHVRESINRDTLAERDTVLWLGQILRDHHDGKGVSELFPKQRVRRTTPGWFKTRGLMEERALSRDL